ncbi:MAG TPA: hypothetical protein VF703_06570 [Pyrinomonadaceae bacterium]|jgi:hypothetical protein
MSSRSLEASKNSFTSHLYVSFRASYGHVTALLGIVLVFLSYFSIPTTQTITTRWLIISIVISLYLIFGLLHAAWTAFYRDKDILPAVRYAAPPPKAIQSSLALLVLDPSIIFSYDSIVGIYSVENEYERLIGLGKVINIQEDRKIQVLVTQDVDFGEQWKAIINREVRLTNIRVKPTVPSFALEVANSYDK